MTAIQTPVNQHINARKMLLEGHLYIVLPDGALYNVTGTKIQ